MKARIDQLAELMEEYRLAEAKWESENHAVELRRKRRTAAVAVAAGEAHVSESDEFVEEAAAPAVPEAPKGTPVASPMNGIYYATPAPGSPPFVKEGDVVNAGQIIGLIEAMKVFNEIPCPVSGTVLKIAVENGQVLAPGEAIIYVG